MVALSGVASALLGCAGGGPAGPSPVALATPAPAPMATPAGPRPLPAGLDRAYILMLSSATPDGRPKVWTAGPMRHCFGPGVDAAALEPVLAEVAALSGIPRAAAGACNVDWTRDDGPGHTFTELHGSDVAIVYAKVVLRSDDVRDARHEAGHVLGMSHSPEPRDLMNATPRVDDFSAAEVAVLAWMYGR